VDENGKDAVLRSEALLDAFARKTMANLENPQEGVISAICMPISPI
jgi:hypothetical protein